MRKLVAEYLSDSISRRAFVGGLTKAGLTATAAQSVLSAVASVSYAQGAGPQPVAPASPPPGPGAGGAAAAPRSASRSEGGDPTASDGVAHRAGGGVVGIEGAAGGEPAVHLAGGNVEVAMGRS